MMRPLLQRHLPLLLFSCWLSGATAATLQVAPGQSIASAVAEAAPGDTVEVEPGFYRENIVIDKPLKLAGIGRPTISGGNKGDVIRVKATDVTIQGLIIRDSGDNLTAQNAGVYLQPGSHRAKVLHNDLTYNLFGTWIEKCNDVVIDSNLINGKRNYPSAQRGNGIELYDSQRAQILNNRISFARDGIYVDISHHAIFRGNRLHNLRYGTHYMNSHYNVWENNESYHNRGGLALMEVRNQIVRNNIAWGNSDHGIMLRTMQDSLIEGNVVAGNGRGFFIYDAEYNTVKDNLVIGNRVGIHLWAGSIHNQVEGNDFIENRDQIRFVAAQDEVWGQQRGNYWSNYQGWDRKGKGTGDIPYEASDIVDRLTWRYPITKLLLNSPAVATLRLIARQFPLLRAPSVVDPNPHMRPFHPDWSKWRDKLRD